MKLVLFLDEFGDVEFVPVVALDFIWKELLLLGKSGRTH